MADSRAAARAVPRGLPRNRHDLVALLHPDLLLNLTLRDLQTTLKQRGAPWERAKGFDGAAPLGDFQPYLEQDLQDLHFTCHVNGTLRQHGHTRDMLFSVARQIHILSQLWALEPGDVLYTGTPAGVGPLVPGDDVVLEGAGLGLHRWHCT